MSDVDNEGGYLCVKARGIWGIIVPSSQFYCKLKTTLKKKGNLLSAFPLNVPK